MGSERKPGKETFPDHGQRAGNREAVPLVAFPVATNCSRRVCATTPRGAATSSRWRNGERKREREDEASTYARRLLDSGVQFPGSVSAFRVYRFYRNLPGSARSILELEILISYVPGYSPRVANTTEKMAADFPSRFFRE